MLALLSLGLLACGGVGVRNRDDGEGPGGSGQSGGSAPNGEGGGAAVGGGAVAPAYRDGGSLTQLLQSRGYVWRDLVADFVASDAFRSAPSTPAVGGTP